MSQAPIDYSVSILVAFFAGLFSLLGAFVGAWLARRTEYDKWLRQERSVAFADFLRGIHGVLMKSTDFIYNVSLTEEERDLKVTELFVELNSQEGITRLFLSRGDGKKLLN